MWITLIWLFVYLMVGTQGSVLRKVTAAVVARAVTTMVNTASPFRMQFYSYKRVLHRLFNDQDISKNCDHVLLIENLYIFLWAKLLNGLLV